MHLHKAHRHMRTRVLTFYFWRFRVHSFHILLLICSRLLSLYIFVLLFALLLPRRFSSPCHLVRHTAVCGNSHVPELVFALPRCQLLRCLC